MSNKADSSVTLRHTVRTGLELFLFRFRRKFKRSFNSVELRPSEARAVEQGIDWLRNYLGKPDPRMLRSGDICPFVVASLDKQLMNFRVYGDLKRATAREIADIAVDEAFKFLKFLSDSDDVRELTTVNLLFPNIREEDFANFDNAHSLCKNTLMRRGLMTSVFFPGYKKPGVANPDFKLYQSPFPIVAIRPMALRDIPFVDFNRFAFEEYQRRFGEKFAAGKVPKKYGYVERYEAAQKRFGNRPIEPKS